MLPKIIPLQLRTNRLISKSDNSLFFTNLSTKLCPHLFEAYFDAEIIGIYIHLFYIVKRLNNPEILIQFRYVPQHILKEHYDGVFSS